MAKAAAVRHRDAGLRSEGALRWAGALLLAAVGYIHLALVVDMFGLASRLGVLFLLNAAGALAGLIGLARRSRLLGWGLGLVVAGGAALIKIAMDIHPAIGALIMGGGPRRPGRFRAGSAGARRTPPAGAHPAGHPAHLGGLHGPAHSAVLPLVGSIRSLGVWAVAIELVFAALAIYMLVRKTRSTAA